MTNNDLSYNREVYIQYHEIHEESFRRRIDFFNQNREKISKLNKQDQIKVFLDFLLCLFKIGDYERFLDYVDEQIENVIEFNIVEFNGLDIYYQLILKKCQCFFYLHRDAECEALVPVLYRMNPKNKIPPLVLKKVSKRRRRVWSNKMNGISIFLILFTAVLLFVELVVVRPFYMSYTSSIELLRNSTILFSFFLLFVNQVLIHFFSIQEVKRLQK